MSGGLDVLSLKEDDVTKMLSACTHIGSENVDYQMEQYVYKRRQDGNSIVHLLLKYFGNVARFNPYVGG
jgi:small subunit ribosomal protein SAe